LGVGGWGVGNEETWNDIFPAVGPSKDGYKATKKVFAHVLDREGGDMQGRGVAGVGYAFESLHRVVLSHRGSECSEMKSDPQFTI
jgi:hypothetical protein